MKTKQKTSIWVWLVLAIVLACVCAFAVIGAWSLSQIISPATGDNPSVVAPQTANPQPEQATPQAGNPAQPPDSLQTPGPHTEPPGSSDVAPAITQAAGNLQMATKDETLASFETSAVPVADPLDLAARFNQGVKLPTQLDSPAQIFQTGDQKSFWVTDSDSNQSFQIQATLGFATDHTYFWIDKRVSSYSQRELKKLAQTFEKQIYPTTRAFFGSEWTPGVDNDPHLYILYAKGIGDSVSGYFSSSDAYLPVVREFANGHEMFVLNADNLDLGEKYTYGVLAHEFQHMIHWQIDRNEETWLNEGLANLSMQLNGYTSGGAERIYLRNPDLQLNHWPETTPNRAAHYGASYLFVSYFLDRFGEQITKLFAAHPDNGLASMDRVLAEQGVVDPITGGGIDADDVFGDWAVATFLQDETVGDGRFAYRTLRNLPRPGKAAEISTCPSGEIPAQVNQYGVDIIRIDCKGETTLVFDGEETVPVLPTEPHSGEYLFYSNNGDESDMRLTRRFDFTQHSGELTLAYWTWFDIENDYDYAYLTASLDGETWQILSTPSGTPDDPVGNSYGWGYNGASGGDDNAPLWIQEEVDLSQFTGKQVWLRFEYITDAAVNGEGFVLDDIAIPQIQYFSDFEEDDGGWQAEGFVRIQNRLPQTYIVSIIRVGDETSVEQVLLDGQNRAAIPLSIDRQVDEVILVVSGASRYTRQQAGYQLSIADRE